MLTLRRIASCLQPIGNCSPMETNSRPILEQEKNEIEILLLNHASRSRRLNALDFAAFLQGGGGGTRRQRPADESSGLSERPAAATQTAVATVVWVTALEAPFVPSPAFVKASFKLPSALMRDLKVPVVFTLLTSKKKNRH